MIFAVGVDDGTATDDGDECFVDITMMTLVGNNDVEHDVVSRS